MKAPRILRKQLHPLENIVFITIAIAGVMSGCELWDDIETFGKTKIDFLKTFLRLPNGIPSHNTINRVFSAIRPKFLKWVRSLETY